MKESMGDILNILVAGLSGGLIRVRMMLIKNEKMNAIKVASELVTAAISSYYVGDALVNIIPFDVSWSNNFVYFISGYGGMSLVDFLFRKYVKQE